ncbi:MAG: hypothetical protein ACFE0P_10430 [Oceanicaulis sp.]
MSDQSKRPAQGPAGPRLSELADAAGIGLERKIFKTLYDTLIRPGRAARAAFDRADDHVSQLKLFAVLFGLYLSAGAFFGAPTAMTIESLVPPGQVGAAFDFIRAQGADPVDVNAAMSRWGGFLVWPIMTIASAVYILVLKISKPSVTWFGHVLIYLIASNAMTLIGIPLMAARLVSLELYLALQMSTMIVFIVQLMRLGSSVLELGVGRLILLLCLVLLAFLPTFIIIGVLQLTAAWFVLDLQGVPLFEMMEAARVSAESPSGET